MGCAGSKNVALQSQPPDERDAPTAARKEARRSSKSRSSAKRPANGHDLHLDQEGGDAKHKGNDEQRPEAPPSPNARFDRELEAVFDARDKFYAKLKGYELLDSERARLVNPFFKGGPRWPELRGAHRCLRNAKRRTALIISDGLSDPFPPDEISQEDLANDSFENTGFKFELLGEFRVSQEDLDSDFQVDSWFKRWEAELVDEVTQQLAARGRSVLEMLSKFGGAISTEVPHTALSAAPDAIVSSRGTVGVILFFSQDPALPHKVRLPSGEISLICMRVISDAQLLDILEQESDEDMRQARLDLLRHFAADGSHHITDLARLNPPPAPPVPPEEDVPS